MESNINNSINSVFYINWGDNMDHELVKLAEKYKQKRNNVCTLRESIFKLYEKIIRERESSIIDAISASAAIGSIFFADQIDFSKVTPQLEEAFRLAFPHVELSSLTDRNPDDIRGFISALKGKYFEVIVRDRLNAGEWVGDILLQPGQYAELAENVTQPGWDLQIFDNAGNVIDELQLKATQSLRYVKNALERFPDIDVLTTEEVFDSAAELSDQILNSGISEDELRNAVQAPFESLLDSDLGEFVEDVLPFLPFIIIAVSEGRKVLMGKKTFQVALSDSLFRAVKTGTAMGVGAIVALLDGGLLSIPATMLIRIGFDRFKIMKSIVERLEERMQTIKQMKQRYNRANMIFD